MFVSAYGKKLAGIGGKGKEGKHQKTEAVCLKTTVFMNESGKEIAQLVVRYQLSVADLLIVHDDMDVPLGEFRLQKGRGTAGHKGVQSVIDALGTNDFWRLRFGIGRPSSARGLCRKTIRLEKSKPEGFKNAEEFVLGEFSPGELERIRRAFAEAYPRVLAWVG